LIRKYSVYKSPALRDYSNPCVFYPVAVAQINDYVEVMRHLPEPIYIPGDGLGAGSCAARYLGKKYYSSEPNDIGREAVWLGLITERKSYDESDVMRCKSVFFGNCVYEIFGTSVYENLCRLKKFVFVAVYDEQTLSQLEHGVMELTRGAIAFKRWQERQFFSGHNHKAWYSRDMNIHNEYKYKEYYRRYENMSIYVPIDRVSEGLLNSLCENVPEHSSCQKQDLENYSLNVMHKNFDTLFSRALFTVFWYDMLSFMSIIRDRSLRPWIRRFLKYDKRIVYVGGKLEEVSTDLNIMTIGTRSFINDKVHGKIGSDKSIGDSVYKVYPRYNIISAKAWCALTVQAYDRVDVLEKYDQQENEFIAKIKNPYRKQFLAMGEKLLKIMLVYYDGKSNVARFRLASSLVYGNDLEVLND